MDQLDWELCARGHLTVPHRPVPGGWSATRKLSQRLAVPLPKVAVTWLCSRVTGQVVHPNPDLQTGFWEVCNDSRWVSLGRLTCYSEKRANMKAGPDTGTFSQDAGQIFQGWGFWILDSPARCRWVPFQSLELPHNPSVRPFPG